MTVEQMITKYRMDTPDGVALRAQGRPTAKEMEYIRAHKAEFLAGIAALKNEQEAVRKAAEERRQAEEQAIIERQKPLRRLALCQFGGWDSAAEYQICYVVPDDGEGYADWYKEANPHFVAHESEAVIVDGKDVEAYINRKGDGVLPQDGVLWFIDETDKVAIIEGVERKATEEQTRKDAEAAEAQAKVEAAFAEAKTTGKPVELKRWTEECDGSVDGCSVDIVTKYAMPDGTTKITRTHTY